MPYLAREHPETGRFWYRVRAYRQGRPPEIHAGVTGAFVTGVIRQREEDQ